jgi:hypothetical protein
LGLLVYLDIETGSTERCRRRKAAHAGSGDGEGAFLPVHFLSVDFQQVRLVYR